METVGIGTEGELECLLNFKCNLMIHILNITFFSTRTNHLDFNP